MNSLKKKKKILFPTTSINNYIHVGIIKKIALYKLYLYHFFLFIFFFFPLFIIYTVFFSLFKKNLRSKKMKDH